MPKQTFTSPTSKKTESEPPDSQTDQPAPPPYGAIQTPYHRPGMSRRAIIWSIFAVLGTIILIAAGWLIFFMPSVAPVEENQSRPVALPRLTPSATPSATSSATLEATSAAKTFTFLEPTVTPTPVPGGRVLVLTPQAADTGWVVSDDENIVTIYDPQNHFGDSYLYAGILDGKIYHSGFQFDLRRIPRGTKVYSAGLSLTGLRAVQLDEGRRGMWQVHLLTSDIDSSWSNANFERIKNAVTWTTFEPPLTQEQLGEGRSNHFEFTPQQLELLERRLVEGSDEFGRKISFRIDGPFTGGNNLFAWDSGYGPASQGAKPELFLSLGPPPEETPPPYYQVVTSTPTPENVMTAAAISIQMTAEASRVGTATALPSNWITPFVVTTTPTPENQATAEQMSRLATARALTTGEPPNMVTATPTPTYVIITSTPTPEEIMTAAAEAMRVTAEAAQFGTATPYPSNWVTPVVVTTTPTPGNTATAEYWRAVALTTGTPILTLGNVQTATPTPVFVTVEPIPSLTSTATPSPTPQLIPAVLLGKIVFLTDREGATEEERRWAGLHQATPQIIPQPYVFDPETGQLGRLTDIWPYEVSAVRDAWSADKTYETYTRELLWSNIDNKLAIHYYDYEYKVEAQITRFGAGIDWDPVWSPVRNQIALVSNVSGDDEIWVIDHDGSNPLQLTSSNEAYNAREIGKDTFIPEVNGHPSWSPDGSQLVFWSNRTRNRQIWIMNADGSDQRLLMEWNPYNDYNPVWIKYPDPPPPLEREPDWRFRKPPEENQVSSNR